MKTKQEVIQQHYIDLLNADKFFTLKPFVDENGWCTMFDKKGEKVSHTFKELGFDKDPLGEFVDGGFTDRGHIWRPKSLAGIETNNGWIRIESVNDIPTELTECYVFDDDGDICYYTFGIDNSKDYSEVVNGAITHYQPIIKPLPPIY